MWRSCCTTRLDRPTICLTPDGRLVCRGGRLGTARLPYEQARALADGDQAAQTAALAILIGSARRPPPPTCGSACAPPVYNIPRGPRPTTRDNPFNLTARQMDILALLAEDLTNAEIAARLYISPKTVDHHVSAVLAKLDVHSRQAAATVAQQYLLPNRPK